MHKLLGIYAKVFFYTILILLVVTFVAAVFFSNQIAAIMESMERKQLSTVFAPLVSALEGKTDEGIITAAEGFHQKNASAEFSIQRANGEILFRTPNALVPPVDSFHIRPSDGNLTWKAPSDGNFQMTEPLPNGTTIHMSSVSPGTAVYNEFIVRTVIVLLVLFFIGAICAAWFAHRITKPIKTIAKDTKRMAALEFVPPPIARRDEIGQLAKDVYGMYEGLKSEIERVQEMEESQRYFFSAASHELKTPIASTLILLQGMFDNIGEYSDHPKYLRECIVKMKMHSKIISEILEIVRLTDGRIIPNPENTGLYGLVQSVVAAHQTLFETKGQSMAVSIPEGIFVVADRKMLTRAISNVVLNAIQNTPEQGEVQISYENQDDETLRLLILNKGVSITDETLPRVFEPFYRDDKARSSGQGRSGLGLAIVKKTLDCMAVPFVLENTTEGVCFWMDLPVCAD